MEGPTFLQLYTPIFTLVSTLEINRNEGDSSVVRDKTIELLRAAGQKSQLAEKKSEWVQDAQYAVVALIDESIIRSRWQGKDKWRSLPLGVALGLPANPGVHFFQRLDFWLGSSSPPRELLEVYYTCLGFGYEGKHNQDAGAIAQYKRSLMRILCGSENARPVLSPNAERKADDLKRTDSESFPWVWILAGCSGLLLVLFVILKLLLNSTYQDLTRALTGG